MAFRAKIKMNVLLPRTIAAPALLAATAQGPSPARATLGTRVRVSRASMLMNVHWAVTIAITVPHAVILWVLSRAAAISDILEAGWHVVMPTNASCRHTPVTPMPRARILTGLSHALAMWAGAALA